VPNGVTTVRGRRSGATGWCIAGLAIKAENDWRDRRSQVAMQR